MRDFPGEMRGSRSWGSPVPLTDAVIRNTKPTPKPQRLFDGGGLYLEVSPSGAKLWRWKYRHAGKEKRLALGKFPAVTLRAARKARDEARELLDAGADPGEQRKAAKLTRADQDANSFEVIAREWIAKQRRAWTPANTKRMESLFRRDILPRIGSRPVIELTAPAVLAMARRIEARGALETAHRALGACGQVFRYAVATGRAERDPTRDLRGALPPVKSTHFAAVTEPKQVGELLRAIAGYSGTATVRAALMLAPLTFVRPGELRRARWADIDLEAAEWRYRVTKTDVDHIVPLSAQAVAILRDLYALTGRGEFVFPGARHQQKPMSENAVNAALRYLGIEGDTMTGHGFRAMARTLLDEVMGYRIDIIEHQLAHAVKDPNGRAYNRTAHLPERRRMMQAWADYLDRLRTGADVIELGAVRRQAEGAE